MFYQSTFAGICAREQYNNDTLNSRLKVSDANAEIAGVKITENFFS